MEGTHYVRAVARSWWLVLLALLAGGVGGYAIYATKTPMYRSTVNLIVSGAGSGQQVDELSSRILATQRAFALAKVAPTTPAITAARRAAGYPNANVSVTATSDPTAPFLTINVAGTSPTRTKAIADGYTRTLVATMARLEGKADRNIVINELSPASLPTAPYTPKLKRDAGLGLAIGLVLGLALALVRDSLDYAVRDSDELEQLTGATILGTVPRDSPRDLLPALNRPRSARVEAYRQIRTTLLNSQVRTVAITSALMGEGKTSVATNVAAVFARAGHRVALIDADMRRPRVAAFFGLQPAVGLSDVIAGTMALRDALRITQDGRLAVLPCGRIPADPSEALDSAAMTQVLAQLAADYEYVLVDTPPVLPVTDALVIAPKLDGAVLVVRIGRTRRQQLRHAIYALRRVNADVIGLVANQAGAGSDSDYRYPYEYAGRRRSGTTEVRRAVAPR